MSRKPAATRTMMSFHEIKINDVLAAMIRAAPAGIRNESRFFALK